MKNLTKKIFYALNEIGVPSHIKGYKYIVRSLELIEGDETILERMTTENGLYQTIAREFKTTSSRAERAIRHAVRKCWENSRGKSIDKVFGYTVGYTSKKPVNGLFLAQLNLAINLGIIGSEPE
jgi:two-component system response regulator (stage 0 sporulation protein A)